jgi:hypothetical protein
MENINVVNNNNDMKSKLENDFDKIDENVYNIYRYKFTDDIISELYEFSKLHQYDDKVKFKDAWKEWVDSNISMINREEFRLKDLGYDGCVNSKMYKSCRYYFCKKGNLNVNKSKIDRRKKYIMINSNILNSMDKHIIQNMNIKDYKPSIGYEDYCKLNINLLKEDILSMHQLNMSNDDIKLKIKKTYKNRYFIISRNIEKFKLLIVCDDNDRNDIDTTDSDSHIDDK